MNIYIAKDFNGELMGALLATSREKAKLIWLGTGCSSHSVEEIDHKSYDWTFRKWKRGLMLWNPDDI